MQQFIKQTATDKSLLSGYEKTAILLGELDASSYNIVMAELSLSSKQQRKIRKAMKKLGKYNRDDYRQSKRENEVLEETIDFLKARNLTVRKNQNAAKLNLSQNVQSDFSNMSINNPEGVAKILKNWLSQ